MEYTCRAFFASRKTSSKQTTGSELAVLLLFLWPKAGVVSSSMPSIADITKRVREFRTTSPNFEP